MEKHFLEFSVSKTFPVAPEKIYKCWLNGELHSSMTGGYAECRAEQGSNFTAWHGYISGKNLTLVPHKKIVQSWRTSEFKAEDKDSLVEIILKPVDDGCHLTLKHSKIPVGQPDYEQGWIDHYFEPMSEYFK